MAATHKQSGVVVLEVWLTSTLHKSCAGVSAQYSLPVKSGGRWGTRYSVEIVALSLKILKGRVLVLDVRHGGGTTGHD